MNRRGFDRPQVTQALEHAQTGLAAHAHELSRRERELESRESRCFKMEADLTRRAAAAAETPEERLAPHREAPRDAARGREGVRAHAGRARRAQRRPREPRGSARRARARRHRRRRPGHPEPCRAGRARRTAPAARARDPRRDEERGFGDSLRSLEQQGLRGGSPSHWLYTEPSRGVSSAGRAPALQAGGHRFDPGTLHGSTKWKTA